MNVRLLIKFIFFIMHVRNCKKDVRFNTKLLKLSSRDRQQSRQYIRELISIEKSEIFGIRIAGCENTSDDIKN
jgi:hypothetical protein